MVVALIAFGFAVIAFLCIKGTESVRNLRRDVRSNFANSIIIAARSYSRQADDGFNGYRHNLFSVGYPVVYSLRTRFWSDLRSNLRLLVRRPLLALQHVQR